LNVDAASSACVVAATSSRRACGVAAFASAAGRSFAGAFGDTTFSSARSSASASDADADADGALGTFSEHSASASDADADVGGALSAATCGRVFFTRSLRDTPALRPCFARAAAVAKFAGNPPPVTSTRISSSVHLNAFATATSALVSQRPQMNWRRRVLSTSLSGFAASSGSTIQR
jgi:hypothetical protein